MKIRFTAVPDPDAGTINLYTETEDIFGNIRREMAVEIMRTKDNAVQQALIALGWTPPGETTPAEFDTAQRIQPRELRAIAHRGASPGSTVGDALNKAADYIAHLEYRSAQRGATITGLRAEEKGYQARIDAEQARARQAEAEILTLSNGDRLHKDASNNAHIVQAHIDDLKRRIERLTYPTEPNQSAVETALELAAHPARDKGRTHIGQKLIPHSLDTEDYERTAIRVLAEEVRHLRACNRVLESRAKGQTTRASNATARAEQAEKSARHLHEQLTPKDVAIESLKAEVTHARQLLEVAGLRLLMEHHPHRFAERASPFIRNLAKTELAEPANDFLAKHNSPAADFIRSFWNEPEPEPQPRRTFKPNTPLP